MLLQILRTAKVLEGDATQMLKTAILRMGERYSYQLILFTTYSAVCIVRHRYYSICAKCRQGNELAVICLGR
jgi:hypothetical protein